MYTIRFLQLCLRLATTTVLAAPTADNHYPQTHHIRNQADKEPTMNLTARTPSGHPAAINIITASRPPPPPPLHKRATSARKITCDIPPREENGRIVEWQTFLSVCVRPSARKWSCLRATVGPTVVFGDYAYDDSECLPHEICIDGIWNVELAAKEDNDHESAYCVSVDPDPVDDAAARVRQYRDFHQAAAADRSAPEADDLWERIMGYGYTGESSGTSVVESVFTGPGGVDDPVTMERIEIVAYKSQVLLGRHEWVETGRTACEDCTSWGMQFFDRQTSHFGVSVDLPVGEFPLRAFFLFFSTLEDCLGTVDGGVGKSL